MDICGSLFVPTLHHGIYSKAAGSHIDAAELKKTNSPGLREARYFNNNFGSLALMNNVYDLSFKIVSNNPSTYLYPGMLINFILTDFGLTTRGTVGEKVDTGTYAGSNNDPHTSTSPAHLLGLGGYFLVKSVSYNINGSKDLTEDFEFNCEAKFVGTDGDQLIEKDKKTVREIIEDEVDKKCITAHDNAVKANQVVTAAYNSKAAAGEQATSDFTEINPTTPTGGTPTPATTPAATTPAPAAAPVPQTPPAATPYTISKNLAGAGVSQDENDFINVNFQGPSGVILGARWKVNPDSGDILFDSYVSGGIKGAEVRVVPGKPKKEQ